MGCGQAKYQPTPTGPHSDTGIVDPIYTPPLQPLDEEGPSGWQEAARELRSLKDKVNQLGTMVENSTMPRVGNGNNSSPHCVQVPSEALEQIVQDLKLLKEHVLQPKGEKIQLGSDMLQLDEVQIESVERTCEASLGPVVPAEITLLPSLPKMDADPHTSDGDTSPAVSPHTLNHPARILQLEKELVYAKEREASLQRSLAMESRKLEMEREQARMARQYNEQLVNHMQRLSNEIASTREEVAELRKSMKTASSQGMVSSPLFSGESSLCLSTDRLRLRFDGDWNAKALLNLPFDTLVRIHSFLDAKVFSMIGPISKRWYSATKKGCVSFSVVSIKPQSGSLKFCDMSLAKMLRLVSSYSALEKLTIYNCDKLHSDIPVTPTLRAVKFRRCPMQSMESLAKCAHLVKVDIESDGTGIHDTQAFAQNHTLETLRLSIAIPRSEVLDISMLSTCTALREINLIGRILDSEAVMALGLLPHLTTLYLTASIEKQFGWLSKSSQASSPRTDPQNPESFASSSTTMAKYSIPSSSSSPLEACPDGPSLESRPYFGSLKNLYISSNAAHCSPPNKPHLLHLGPLQEASSLKNIPTLTRLTLFCRANIGSLSGSPQLRELNLWSVVDARELADFGSLRRLAIHCSPFLTSIKGFERLWNLSHLVIKDCNQISDIGTLWKKCPHLEELVIQRSDLSDASVQLICNDILESMVTSGRGHPNAEGLTSLTSSTNVVWPSMIAPASLMAEKWEDRVGSWNIPQPSTISPVPSIGCMTPPGRCTPVAHDDRMTVEMELGEDDGLTSATKTRVASKEAPSSSCRLKILNLVDNNITDQGAKCIANLLYAGVTFETERGESTTRSRPYPDSNGEGAPSTPRNGPFDGFLATNPRRPGVQGVNSLASYASSFDDRMSACHSETFEDNDAVVSDTHLWYRGITHLHLSGNKIGREGLLCLLDATSNGNVKDFDLRSRSIKVLNAMSE